MRNIIIITIAFAAAFALLRLAGIITAGWFLGLGAAFVVFGILMVFLMTGVMEGEWQLQLGGLLLTLGIVMVIISWLLGQG